MSPIQWLLLAIGGALVLLCWLRRDLDAPEDQPHRVGFGKFARWVIVGGYLVCAMLAPLAQLTGVPEAAWAMTVFALLFAMLAPSPFLCTIRYGENGLTIRTWFGVTHRLRWEDIVSVPAYTLARTGCMILRTTNRKFTLNPQMMGCDRFICYARARCRCLGMAVKPPKSRIDPFNGHVVNPGYYVGLWIAGGLLFIGMAVASVASYFITGCTNTDALLLAGVGLVGLVALVVEILCSIEVGRHPDKYSPQAFKRHFGRNSRRRPLKKK